ncbi:MAG: 1,4-alpha-glucan branching protein GlgB [Saccharofermentanales bacterium]
MKAFSYEQAFLFNTGLDFMSYNLLGAHPIVNGISNDADAEGYIFSVWAPEAKSVHIVGDFNNWDTKADKMQKMGDTGIFSTTIPNARKWDKYKFFIATKDNRKLYKADPYAFHSETRPETSSILYPIDDGYQWNDDSFIAKRDSGKKNKGSLAPLNIYEIHLGSWRKHVDGSFMNYRDIAAQLADYMVSMGYTHVELLPVMEHPLDDSWGYQVTGFYSPTSRFGDPSDFKFFVDHLHSKKIKVILDWVPGHFPKNDYALARYDGSALFEYADDRVGEHKEWGTSVFNYARDEVRSFLISNAIYWIKVFHIDGIRVDAVSSMLYLNYNRTDFIANKYGGFENLEAVSLLQKLNDIVRCEFPGIMMIAEESTSWPKVTAPASEGGLGFSYKWNMGWMHDTLEYASKDYIYRKWHHSQLTFSMLYAFSEKFILPLSHDEVVHGKKSLIDKMPGDYWKKFAQLRCLFGYMMSMPGGKLLFMGGEFGQFLEWRFYEQLEWNLLDLHMHAKLHEYVKMINHLYLKHKPLWQNNENWDGFQWNNADDSQNSVYSFTRKSVGDDEILVVLNMLPTPVAEYKIGVGDCNQYKLILNSDSEEYGGSGYMKKSSRMFSCTRDGRDGFPCTVTLPIPPLCALYLKKKKTQ